MKINNKNIVFLLLLFVSYTTTFCVLYLAFRMHYLVCFCIVALSMFYSLAFKWFAKDDLEQQYNDLLKLNKECVENLDEFKEKNKNQKKQIQNLEEKIHRFSKLNNVDISEFGIK